MQNWCIGERLAIAVQDTLHWSGNSCIQFITSPTLRHLPPDFARWLSCVLTFFTHADRSILHSSLSLSNTAPLGPWFLTMLSPKTGLRENCNSHGFYATFILFLFNSFFMAAPRLHKYLTSSTWLNANLMTENTHCSETVETDYNTTRCHKPEDQNLHKILAF